MRKIIMLLLAALFFQCTEVRQRDAGIQYTELEITDQVLNENFGGFGFHVFYHIHEAPDWHYDQVFAKRWRELNPSFARVTDYPGWDTEKLDRMASYLDVMKGSGTELYFTTWGANAINDYDNEIEYVRKEVDNLEYWIREKGFSNLNYYCMTNELSLESWASMVDDLDRFKRIQRMFYDEFKERDLHIKLLATDASPIQNWPTIEWATENMDEITGVYGGHHYINGYDLFDLSFYPFFLDKLKWGAGIAKSKEKNFIIGEFGPKQNSNIIDSVRHDACIYNNTALEPYAPLQVAEALLAMINSGVYASSYWTFSDFPSDYRDTYINKWGVFKWGTGDYTTRPNYYALGLFTKFFRGPAKVYEVNSSDSLIRAGIIKNSESNSVSLAVVNRSSKDQIIDFNINLNASKNIFRKYVYDPSDPPFNYYGDLQDFTKTVPVEDGKMQDTIPSNNVVIYTTHYDNDPPSPVKGLRANRKELEGRDRAVLTWNHNTEEDFCYYRVYRSREKDFEIDPKYQVASTIQNEFIDKTVHGLPEYFYKVIAVDNSGNASE